MQPYIPWLSLTKINQFVRLKCNMISTLVIQENKSFSHQTRDTSRHLNTIKGDSNIRGSPHLGVMSTKYAKLLLIYFQRDYKL